MDVILPMLVTVAVTGALFWGLFRMLKPAPGKPMVCTTCGHHGPTKLQAKGSLGLELVLWLCFILPGLLYSLWRVSSKRQVCAECGADQLVPEKSPVGRRLMQQS